MKITEDNRVKPHIYWLAVVGIFVCQASQAIPVECTSDSDCLQDECCVGMECTTFPCGKTPTHLRRETGPNAQLKNLLRDWVARTGDTQLCVAKE